MRFSDVPHNADPTFEAAEPAPDWLRKPASIKPVESVKDFQERADTYFEHCSDNEIRPTITGFALAVGLPGPTSLIRLGQRIPALRFPISACMTAIAHGYELMVGSGNSAGAQFMLKNIPDFDPEEPEGSPGVQFFNDRKEVLLQAEVVGAVTIGDDFDDAIDPLDVYLSVIKKPMKKKALGTNYPEDRPAAPTTPRLFQIIESGTVE